jgi:hypothetical protein
MPGKFDCIGIAVFDQAVFGGAEQFGQGVVQREAGHGSKKFRIAHGRLLL